MAGVARFENEIKESEIALYFEDHSNIQVGIVKMPDDGNSLFRTLAHQMFKIPTKHHNFEKTVNELRKMVVLHIEQNIDDYMFDIKNTLAYRNRKSFDGINEEECINYIKTILPEDSEQGGSEVINAVAALCNKEIIIAAEAYGAFYIIKRCNENHNSTIILAYEVKGQTPTHNHYCSLFQIAPSNLQSTSKIKWKSTDSVFSGFTPVGKLFLTWKRAYKNNKSRVRCCHNMYFLFPFDI